MEKVGMDNQRYLHCSMKFIGIETSLFTNTFQINNVELKTDIREYP